MYRVVAVFGSALLLVACSVNPMNLDAFKPAPLLDSVRLESEPPGAQAKSSNGQTCVTPCALALPTDAPVSVTFTLKGYLTDTENLQVVQDTASTPQLRPNPLRVELAMVPPPPKPPKQAKKKQIAAKKLAKPAPKPAETQTSAARGPAPEPMVAEPPPSQTLSPWPDLPPSQR
jgi:hypothetical protein